MFDHNIFQENLVGVDYCEKMVAETNPSVLAKAENTEAPQADAHGYRTIADIMRALKPVHRRILPRPCRSAGTPGDVLPHGRQACPSVDVVSGRVGTTATIQLMTDYPTRLMRYVEFMKKVVPMHDDLFDFFYEACPATKVGLRRTLLGCWGRSRIPRCNFSYRDMERWGRRMFVTPGIVVDGNLVTTRWSISIWGSESCWATLL